MNNEEIKKLISEKVTLYNTVLNTVAERVQKTMTRPAEHSDGDIVIMDISDSDRKDIATSIFIEVSKQLEKEEKAEAPATDAQKDFIAGLLEKHGKKAEAWLSKYLEFCQLETGEQLTKEQASAAITELKKL